MAECTRSITIFGASDDIVCVTGDVRDETGPGRAIVIGDKTRGDEHGPILKCVTRAEVVAEAIASAKAAREILDKVIADAEKESNR